MKLPVVLAVLIGILVLACSTAAPAPAEPTPNIDATVVAGVKGTQEARVAQERAIDATVEARLNEAKTSQPTSGPSPTDTPMPVPTSVPMLAPTPTLAPRPHPTSTLPPRPIKKNREIVFAGLNWTSALVQNGVARYIVELGYGYKTSEIAGTTEPLFTGLTKRGDVDVLMELWLPNQNEIWYDALRLGEVFSAGKSLEDNWQSTFLIPGYLQEQYPELDSVENLKEPRYRELFADSYSGGRAVLWGCVAGWACRTIQEGSGVTPSQIESYGLSNHIDLRDPGTHEAMDANIRAAFSNKAPILFYYWGPTALMRDLGYPTGVVDLEQPDPYECHYSSPAYGCAFPHAEIMIALNVSLVNEAPELVAFFQEWDWNAGNQLAAEDWHAVNSEALADKGASSEEIFNATGVWYLKNYDAWKSWVPDDVRQNVEKALSNNAKIGIDEPTSRIILPTATPEPEVLPATRDSDYFGDGTWVVGSDIKAGTYRSSQTGNSCYWQRLSGFSGELDDIIANGVTDAIWVVEIASTDAGFSTERCGTWTEATSATTSSLTSPFGDGMFLVGMDISPGTWKSPGGDYCYWARLSGFSGDLNHIKANGVGGSNNILTIEPADKGFESTNCGTWTKTG